MMNFNTSTEILPCWETISEGLSVPIFLKLVSLGTFILAVILGNALVVLSVALHSRLHTTTNYIICSLATSDLALGLFVLPFSASQAVSRDHWLYGYAWCQIWLALDVFLCTASIYNLVAISLDRYLALSRPLSYKIISPTKMGLRFVATAWAAALAICLPPLLRPRPTDALLEAPSPCSCTPLHNDSAYIAYSSMGSFYIPGALVPLPDPVN